MIRIYAAKQPECPRPDLVPIIEHIEPDAVNLDMEASLYLDGLVDEGCPLDGDGFYQSCISAVATKHQPSWSTAMKQGRMRFLDSLETNDRDVFGAAGLAKDPAPPGVVAWWDEVTGFARLASDLEKMKQARRAERLTLEYEIKRLAQLGITLSPIWKGLDDNFAGYDVLSYDVGQYAPVNRMIEVKSTVASPLRFIVTRNEWEQAVKLGPAYIFHVWDMDKEMPILYERTTAQVAKHIPKDNEKGVWKTALIPVGV